jgi:hypothetical protein
LEKLQRLIKMTQALVYNANIANVTWNTDKAEIVTSGAYATWNIYVMATGNLPVAGIVGDVTAASNIMITPNASQELVNATFVTGPGVANTTTVVSAVNGQSLLMSANASSTNPQGQYTLSTADPGNMYNNAPIVAPNSRQQVYVGAGNKFTVASSAQITIREIGTASSATAGK